MKMWSRWVETYALSYHCSLQSQAAEEKPWAISVVPAERSSATLHACGLRSAGVKSGKQPVWWTWHKATEQRCSRSPSAEDDTVSFKWRMPSKFGLFPIPSVFVSLPFAQQASVLEERVIAPLPLEPNIPTGRRGKEADEYCMIRARERDGAVAAFLAAERQTHTSRRCLQHQQISLWPLFPSPYPASWQFQRSVLLTMAHWTPRHSGFSFGGARKHLLLFPTFIPRLRSPMGEARRVSSSSPLPWRCPIPMQSLYHKNTLSNKPQRHGLAWSLLWLHGCC